MNPLQTAMLDLIPQFFFARLAPRACFVLALALASAFAPYRALGQQYVYPSTTFQRGQWEQTIPGFRHPPGGQNVRIPYEFVDTMFCFGALGMPNEADIKTRIASLQTIGQLKPKLDTLEAAPAKPQSANEVELLRVALGDFLGRSPSLASGAGSLTLSSSGLLSAWDAGSSFKPLLEAQCLGSPEWLAYVRELRRVVRLYLGMPPP